MNSKEWFFLGFLKSFVKVVLYDLFFCIILYEFVYQTYSDNQLSICEYVIQQKPGVLKEHDFFFFFNSL